MTTKRLESIFDEIKTSIWNAEMRLEKFKRKHPELDIDYEED